MARTFTASQLVTAAQQRADMENSSVVGDAEWLTYCSQSYTKLYNMLVRAGLYYLASDTITADGNSAYALPADYYGTVRLDYQQASGSYWPLRRISVAQRSDYEIQGGSNYATAFYLAGANIELLPAPSSGSYRHLYIPAPADIDDGADSIDGVAGFEEYIVLDMAIKAATKEEASTTVLEREREKMEEHIEVMATNREWGDAGCVVDIRRQHESLPLPGDFHPWGGGIG